MRPPRKQIIPTQADVDEVDKDSVQSDALESTESESTPSGETKKSGFVPSIQANVVKKGIKIASATIMVAVVGYKMFFSNAVHVPTQEEIDQGVVEAPKKPDPTPKDFANEDIPSSKLSGSIAKPSKKDDKSANMSQAAERPDSISLNLKDVKLEAPDLPQLPDLMDDVGIKMSDNHEKLRDNSHKPPSIDKITTGNDYSANNSDTQNQAQPFNPQNVTNGGIPIVNSSDLNMEQKRQLTMFVVNGGGPQSSQNSGAKNSKNDIIIVDGSNLNIKKPSDKVNSEKVTNLDTTIIQGKMLDGILETAINSQLPGTVRGVVTGDVYGEMGSNVLIPRGSRIYGSYSTTVTRGQSRIQINWNRLIRPDGVSVSISLQASDQFGRAGVEGDVDNRFGDTFTNSLLVTFATLGAAVALDKIAGSSASQSQTINPSGTFTTSNINPVSVAAQSAIQTMQNFTNKMTEGSTQLQPIVTLPQGTKIKIMVTQDLVLPVFKKVKLP